MNAQHTPGPWAVHDRRAYVVPAAHRLRPIGGSSDKARDLAEYAQEICAVQWPDRHRTEAEVKANAQLIAAAPDLLAACKVAFDQTCSVGRPKDWQQIAAAIAKATGSAP